MVELPKDNISSACVVFCLLGGSHLKFFVLVLVWLGVMIVTVVLPSPMTIEEALKKHSEELMAIPGVVGVGQGLCDGAPCIKVLVTEITPELEKFVPDKLEGYRVEVVVRGRIRAHPGSQD